MKLHMKAGKMRFSSILIVAILFYGGFVAVKIVSANIMQGQIKTNIIDRIGHLRGPDFTVEQGIKIVIDVLRENNVLEAEYDDTEDEEGEADTASYTDMGSGDEDEEFQRIDVKINSKENLVEFFVTYKYEINFIFFKQLKYYEVVGEVQNYN